MSEQRPAVSGTSSAGRIGAYGETSDIDGAGLSFAVGWVHRRVGRPDGQVLRARERTRKR